MKALDHNGIAGNTILLFASDNGSPPSADFQELAALGHHPSYIFRGHKADIYEGGHRIPLLVRWPDKIKAGSVCDETVCLADLLATCADIVGEEAAVQRRRRQRQQPAPLAGRTFQLRPYAKRPFTLR